MDMLQTAREHLANSTGHEMEEVHVAFAPIDCAQAQAAALIAIAEQLERLNDRLDAFTRHYDGDLALRVFQQST